MTNWKETAKKVGWTVIVLIFAIGIIRTTINLSDQFRFTRSTPFTRMGRQAILPLPPTHEVLLDEYGHRDLILPVDGTWSEELDARGEQEKLPNGTLRFTHPEWIGKYRLEWGRYDRNHRVEVMFDGDPKRVFLVPAGQSKPAINVKFRSLDPEKEVKLFILWKKM